MNLTLFNYKDSKIRSVEKDGETWFVVKDVCEILELNNVTKACLKLFEHEKTLTKIQTLGGMQMMNVVKEGAVYKLITHSKMPEAQAFQDWFFHDVVPSIRRTGSYSVVKPQTTKEVVQSMNNSPLVQQAEMFLKFAQGQEKLALEQQAQKEEIAEVKQIALETKEKVEKPETIEVTHFSVIGWSRLQNAKVPDKSFAAQIGKKLKPLCDMKKLELKKQANHEYGYIWLYPREILESHFLPFYEEIQAKRLAKEKSVC